MSRRIPSIYYSSLIKKHGDWEYIGVYADGAMIGTKECRDEFQRLLSDCRAGHIDLILTKSISRFARNTVTLRHVWEKLPPKDYEHRHHMGLCHLQHQRQEILRF